MKLAPTITVRNNSRNGLTHPSNVRIPRISVVTDSAIMLIVISRLRSTRSASVPANNPTKIDGAVLAVCTSATISADGVSVAITHALIVVCIM